MVEGMDGGAGTAIAVFILAGRVDVIAAGANEALAIGRFVSRCRPFE